MILLIFFEVIIFLVCFRRSNTSFEFLTPSNKSTISFLFWKFGSIRYILRLLSMISSRILLLTLVAMFGFPRQMLIRFFEVKLMQWLSKLYQISFDSSQALSFLNDSFRNIKQFPTSI